MVSITEWWGDLKAGLVTTCPVSANPRAIVEGENHGETLEIKAIRFFGPVGGGGLAERGHCPAVCQISGEGVFHHGVNGEDRVGVEADEQLEAFFVNGGKTAQDFVRDKRCFRDSVLVEGDEHTTAAASVGKCFKPVLDVTDVRDH